MEKVFVVGDVVQLKAGGPLMTVNSVNIDNVNCCWFENLPGGGYGSLQIANFNLDCLNLVTGNSFLGITS